MKISKETVIASLVTTLLAPMERLDIEAFQRGIDEIADNPHIGDDMKHEIFEKAYEILSNIKVKVAAYDMEGAPKVEKGGVDDDA